MKSHDLQIAEAVQDAAWNCVRGMYYKDDALRAIGNLDLAAIIASVPAPEPVAWRVMVRRADTDWRLYALYENEKSANATRLKIEGDPLQVNVQPVYAEPPAAEINQQLLIVLKAIVGNRCEDARGSVVLPSQLHTAWDVIDMAEKELSCGGAK